MVLVSMLLAGCNPAFLDGRPNLSSPYYRPATGSMLEIRQPVEVAARSDRAYFQDGRQRAWQEVNEYRPYCALMVTERADQARTIAPGTYRVEAVSQRPVFQLARWPAPARAVPVAERNRGRDDYHALALVLKLAGPDERLQGLACVEWGLPQGLPEVTVEGIRASLGPGFELQLAAG